MNYKNKPFFKQLRLVGRLLKTDLLIFKTQFANMIIDNCFWISICTLISAYVLPKLGMTSSYGAFFVIGAIGSSAVFQTFGNVSRVVADLDGEKIITYPLTLPLPGWLLMVQKALSFAVQSALIGLVILPIGKLLLMDRLNLSLINPLQFFVIYITLQIFIAGFFTMFFVSITEKMSRILNVWTRVLFPLWFMGGSQFSWQTLHQVSPSFAKICLFNPFIYAFEGLHAATLGQDGYLPFWLCVGMIWLFIIVFAVISIRRMKKRLDFI